MLQRYLLASRPKTLPAAVVPVWVGCVLGWKLSGQFRLSWALCTLAGAVCIQIATNYFNDAIDAGKGADTGKRLGPVRATASGLLPPRAVYGAAVVFVLLAVLAGLPLVMLRGAPILVIGLVSLYFAFGYTGGPFPLAYRGLGELFVILFFGLVAVTGTVFVQTGGWHWEAAVVGTQAGLLSAVLISINNIRDVEEDRASRKRTLAVRFGEVAAKRLVVAMTTGAFLLTLCGGALGMPWLPVVCLPVAVLGASLCRAVLQSAPGERYNFFLALAAVQLVLFAVGFTVAACI
ncbi:MAG: 1,4-dihydroxy-2-naphthoate octaprenyltransferase [Akkermansiaceae bacterium]|nr:1,4-dihydroxy-2-naphthoate octaprenyltransferase [Akkermansiaceae bacterium]